MDMIGKSAIAALGFLGLVVAGTAAGSAPAAAGYACGPWNAWCGRSFFVYPSYGYGWYGHNHWNNHWNNDKHWNKGKQAYKNKHWKKYH
jgi:hypothetical protein